MIVIKYLFFETKKVTFYPLIKFQFLSKSLKINKFTNLVPFGIEIAAKYIRLKISKKILLIKPNHE
jgi:hypothetical protein